MLSCIPYEKYFQKRASYLEKVEAFRLVISLHNEMESKDLVWTSHRKVRCLS